MRIKTNLAFLLVLCSPVAVAQNVSDITHSYNVTNFRYWFDMDEKTNVGTFKSGTLNLDASSLEEGFHTLHFHVVTSAGEVSPTYTQSVYRVKEQPSKYSISAIRYWFDMDADTRQASYHSGTTTFDVVGLEEGFHTLHYQVLTAEGTASPTYTRSFFRVKEQPTGYSISTVRYWFEMDADTRQASYHSGTTTFDVAGLEEGFHTLHYQVLTADGTASPTYTRSFFRIKEQPTGYNISTVRYWFDMDAYTRLASYHSGTTTFDVAGLEEGFHTLHYQVLTTDGTASPTYTRSFFRAKEHPTGYSINTVRYWFDMDTDTRQATYHSGTTTLDVADLEEGFHTLHYQVLTSDGELSPAYTCSFFRVTRAMEHFKDYAVKTVRYWFDSDETTAITGDYADGLLQLDLSHLPEGQHTMTYQVVADNGEVSPATTIEFYRNLYDVYVRTDEEYAQSTIDADAALSSKPDLKLHYETAQPEVRGHLTVDADATLSLGKFVHTGHLGSNNSSNKYTHEGDDYYHLTTLVNHGFMRADSVHVKERFYRDRWHFISLPFTTNVSDIRVPEGTYWALREYDGEQRAAGNMIDAWENLRPGDQMQAGQGYILQLTSETKDKAVELTFPSVNDAKKNSIFTTTDAEVMLTEHEAEFAHNRGWNFVGNPYPAFYDTRCINHSGTITIWNGNGYSAYSLEDDKYVLMPFEAFFIQKPLDASSLTFHAEGRQHTHVAAEQPAVQRKAPIKNDIKRRLLNFTLLNDNASDRSRVVLNPDALLCYESDKDAAKFMQARPTSPQLYSIEGGVKYAINERPLSDGFITFSMYAPTSGEYTLQIEAPGMEVTLLDRETNEITALDRDAYTFYAEAGGHEARFVIGLGDAHPTAVSQIAAGEEGEMQVVDHTLHFNFLRSKQIVVYGADGRVYYRANAATGAVQLSDGIYVIEVDGQTEKVVVK